MTTLYAITSLLLLIAGGLFLAHHGMTAELIVLGSFAAFLVAVPLMSRMERVT